MRSSLATSHNPTLAAQLATLQARSSGFLPHTLSSLRLHRPLKAFAHVLACAGLCIGFGMGVHAQVLPNAGDVQRQNAAPAPTLPRPDAQLPKAQEVRPALQTASGFSVVVNGFRITGNSSLKETDLQLLLLDNLGKKVGFNDLQNAADNLSRYYRERGYFVARAYLPQQEIKDGIIEIAVLEGRVGATAVKQEGSSRTAAAVALAYLNNNVPVGSVVHEKSIERAALLANDLPGINAAASLDPGANTGDTNVTLTTQEGKLFNATVDLDNYGSRFTGDIRLGATLNFNSPLGLGDQATVRLMHSDKDLSMLRANYQLPVGGNGGRIGVAASRVQFEVCCQVGFNPTGSSNLLSVYGLYPLQRQRDRSIYLNANFDNKQSVNNNGVVASNRELNVLTLGGSLESRDDLGGGGTVHGNVSIVTGNLSLKEAAAQTTDAAGPKAAGSFTKVGLQLSRTQRLSDRVSLFGGLNGQLASKNLDSAEKFGLGGASGVRGYPSGEASGDAGFVAQIELRADLPFSPGNTQWQGFVFYDHGDISVNQRNYIVGGLTPNHYSLQGWGIGLNITKAGSFQLRSILASKIGDNPGRNSITGNDADGKNSRSRFWFQAVTQF